MSILVILSLLAVAPSAAAADAAIRPVGTETAVPMVESSRSLFRHTATPTASSARYEATASQSSGSSLPILTPRTTREKKSSGLSGGASASGLMLSGSQYAGGSKSGADNGGASVSSADAPTGPRRKPGTQTGEPMLDPIGDALLPLALLALAYSIWHMVHRRKRA